MAKTDRMHEVSYNNHSESSACLSLYEKDVRMSYCNGIIPVGLVSQPWDLSTKI